MKGKLVEAFGLFVIIIAGSVILKIVAAFIAWIPYKVVFEIGLVAALMWLTPLGLVPTKKVVTKMTERWKGIDV